jgi:hypothetical protein
MVDKSIEDADSPEAFIKALRKQSEKCMEASLELSAAWQTRTAGHFWVFASRELERMAIRLEKHVP